MLFKMLDDTTSTPYGTPIDKMMHYFAQKKDVSFMYVMHDMDSGFVTYRKNKDDICVNESGMKNDECIFVYKAAAESWRKEPKVINSEKILVAFTWSHDEELRLCKMFPEFLACDVTFGVTKERRNLFLIAGVDANKKVFTCFHCLCLQNKPMLFIGRCK